MNVWKGTAVIKKDPVLQKNGNQTLFLFTACNTEIVKDASGAIVGRDEFWLDCRWVNPEWAQICRFKALSLIYLEGACHDRFFTRQDGSNDRGIVLEVTNGVWQRQVGDTQASRSDSSAD